MNKLAVTVLSACLSLATGHAFGQDAMSKEAMKKGAAPKDAMAPDVLKK